MQNKLFTTILCLILLLTSVPLTTTADENSDDTTDSSLTASQITDFVNEWTNIILHPDSYNLSSLPPEEKYANLTTEDKQVLVETLLSRLENESSEIYQDLHPSNATQQEIHEKYEQLKAFLSSFIFDRENLMHQLENTTQGLTEQYNGSEDTMQNEGNSTIVWGQSDTYEKNLAEIQQVGVENNVDTIINNAVTYESELKNGLVSTTAPPLTIEKTFDKMPITKEESATLFNLVSKGSKPKLFQLGNVTFGNRIRNLLGKIGSILDSLTYAVYIRSGNTTTYIKRLTFCQAHRLNVDNKLLTGPFGKDVSIKAGLKVIPSLRDRTVYIGVDFTVKRLCTLRNRTLPLEIIAFFRIPDSPGGRNDHIVMLGYSSEKNVFNSKENAPKRVSFSLLVNMKGEVVVDVKTRGAEDGLQVTAGIGNRNVDEHGNIGVVNVTKMQCFFRPSPKHFTITLDTQRFSLEPLTMKLSTINPVSVATQISSRGFGIQFLISQIRETTTMFFSWENGSFIYDTPQPINISLVQIAGDFGNIRLIDTSHVGDVEETVYPYDESGAIDFIILVRQKIMSFSDNVSIRFFDSFLEKKAPYLLKVDAPLDGEIFYPDEKPTQQTCSYIHALSSGESTTGYYLGVATLVMPSNINLRWRGLNYFTFTMNQSLGAFDVTFINLSRTIIAWPQTGNLVGAQLNTGAKMRIWNVPLQNVTIDLERRRVHVNLIHELNMFFYLGAELQNKPLNISGLIGSIPPGDIDIYCNLTNISYVAENNIDLMASFITYKGLAAAVGLVSLPRRIKASWDFKNGEISMNMNEDIGNVFFSSTFNYYYLRTGNFPPPASAVKDTTVYFAANGIPSFSVNWSNGVRYQGDVEHGGANIVFKLFKKDNLGHYDYYPLTTQHGLTVYMNLYTPSDPLRIKNMGIIGNFNTPTYVSYRRDSDDKTFVSIDMDHDMTDVMIKTRIKFIFPNKGMGFSMLCNNIPRDIDISFEKNMNNLSYSASRSATINAYMEYGKPSLIAITPNPPYNNVGLRLNYKENDVAFKGRLQITIPSSFFMHYNLDKKNHIMGLFLTSSSPVAKGVDVNAYIDAHIGGIHIRDTTMRITLSNIPTQIFLGSMYHIRGGSMWASVSYVANQGINRVFAGVQRPDSYGIKDWAAYLDIRDIPDEFSVTIGKDGDFPFMDYSASASTLDIIAMLDGTRFQDLISIPYINQLPYLEVNMIDIPAHGVTINYNKNSQRCTIRANNYPVEQVGEFTVRFNVVVGGSYDKYDENRWGWSWIGIYFTYWVHLYLQVGVKEYILEVKNWNQIVIDLDAPEIILTLDGPPGVSFYMKWVIQVQFSIDAGLRTGLYLKVAGDTYHLRFLKIDADWSFSGYIQLHNYVWDDNWPKEKITLIKIWPIIKAGVEYRWPSIHHSVNEITLNGPSTYHWMISPWDSSTLIKLYIVIKYWGKFSSSIGWWYDWYPW